jgi:hypothetical protein
MDGSFTAWMAGTSPAMTAIGVFGDRCETGGRMRISPLFAWRSGAREEFEVKDAP